MQSLSDIIDQYITDPNDAEQFARAIHEIIVTDASMISDLQSQYEQMFHFLPEGILLVNRDGIIMLANTQAAILLGLDAADLVGRSYTEYDWNVAQSAPETPLVQQHPLSMSLRTGHAQKSVIVMIKKPDQSRAWLAMTTHAVYKDDTILGVMAIFNDVTQQKLQNWIEPELERERIRILNDFVRDASHEFRSPLATIHTKLYLMSRKYDELAESNDIVAINKYLDQITELVDKLELMVKLDDRKRWTIYAVKLRQVVQSQIEHYQYVYAGKIELQADTTRPYLVFANDELVSMALKQVLDNAITFSSDAETITVRLREEGEYLFVDVIDRGIGMTPEVLARVYERFFRLDPARTRRGFGLGLSIVERIMAIHSKQLTITSTPGEGTTVSMGFNSVSAIGM